MITNGDLRFYSRTEISQILDISRPTVDKYIREIQEIINSDIWELHTKTLKSTNRGEKRPTLYVSEYIYDIVSSKISYNNYVAKLYDKLPKERNILKDMILSYTLPNDPVAQELEQHGAGKASKETIINLLSKDQVLEQLKNC